MKRLISSLVLTCSFVFALSGTALASHYWTLEMFRPSGAVTGNSFNVEYKAFSVEKDDDFTVRLFQNGSVIATQNTTKDYGDSGVFTVTVPGPGTYQYHISATSSIGEGETKTTEDRTLTVTTTSAGTVNTVFVNQANAAGAGAAGGGAGGVGAGAGAAAAGGEVAGAAANAATGGQVNAQGESTTDENGDVLGADKKSEDNAKKDSNSWLWWIPVAMLALGAGGYYYLQRAGNPFKKG